MPRFVKSLQDIDWNRWQAKDPATLVFVVDGSRVLLIRKKRGLGAGKVNAPGGRVEPGEKPLEAAIRESQEELRITPTGLTYSGENLFQFVDGYSIHVHVYKATGYTGEPEETDEAIPLWTALDAIPYDEMWEDDRLWVPLVFEGVRFSGRYVFDDDVMLDYALDVG